MRVRVAEKTMKQPATVSASWAVISTQSMFRLGSAGLERMLPSPESGLRCSIDRAIGRLSRRAGPARCDAGHAADVDVTHRLGAATGSVTSSGSDTSTGSRGMLPDRARNVHFTTGAAPVEPKPDFSRYDTTVYGCSGWML